MTENNRMFLTVEVYILEKILLWTGLEEHRFVISYRSTEE
jgi:hypothetical protein